MKLHLSSTAGQNFFSGYGDGYVQINQQRYSGSLIVLPNQIIENWISGGLEKLSAQDFEILLNRDLEIVLIGTGKICIFPTRPYLHH